ncbi:peptidoglycan recognition protein family protein [Methylocystis heyeri]|nr:N-acetylmuramoyl-L-alanine amidase [Methylocystis heyeri]
MATILTKVLNIVDAIIPAGHPNRPGKKLLVSGVTIHNTDNTNKGADAKAHSKFLIKTGYYMLQGKKHYVSWHFTVDDHEIYHHLPTDEIGWHAGRGNTKTLAIEICMNAGIDHSAANKRAAQLAAGLLHDFKLDITCLYSHNHWTGKVCPKLLLDHHHEGAKWIAFKALVAEAAAELASGKRAILSKEPAHIDPKHLHYTIEDETNEIDHHSLILPEEDLTK